MAGGPPDSFDIKPRGPDAFNRNIEMKVIERTQNVLQKARYRREADEKRLGLLKKEVDLEGQQP